MKIVSIAHNTFREAVRDRVLHGLGALCLLAIGASLVLGRIAAGQEARIVVDVGLSAMTLFGLLIAIFLGVGLVAKEIERRTIANILAKPVGRATFLVGKYLGLCLALAVNLAALTVVIVLALVYVRGGVDAMAWRVWPAAWLILCELAIITAVALLCSCFSSPLLSSLFALLVFLIGRWSPDLRLLAETAASPATRLVSRALYYLLPNLTYFNFINEAARGVAIPARLVLGATFYAVCYCAAALVVGALIFARRDFK